jgi:glutaminyl-peptide cyclotransferase
MRVIIDDDDGLDEDDVFVEEDALGGGEMEDLGGGGRKQGRGSGGVGLGIYNRSGKLDLFRFNLLTGCIVTFTAVLSILILALMVTGYSRKSSHDGAAPSSKYNNSVGYVAGELENTPRLFEYIDTIVSTPRVPGTSGNARAREYILGILRTLPFQSIWLDVFNATTPIGVIEMTNIVATTRKDAAERLVLSCHYDTKRNPAGFVGAIDSAVPCAIVMDVATSLIADLLASPSSTIALELHFFDGEEAFNYWSHSDSTYGSRHLVSVLEGVDVVVDATSPSVTIPYLSTIKQLVLLDLIGTANPVFHPYFSSTKDDYSVMQKIETYIRRREEDVEGGGYVQWFTSRSGGGIEDDHLPYLQNHVPVMHLIPSPFPSLWHDMSDDSHHLDVRTCVSINAIVRVYVAWYLRLLVDDHVFQK